MAQMFVFHSDVVIGQHGHVFYLGLVLLSQSVAKSFLVVVKVAQTGFDGLYCFLV